MPAFGNKLVQADRASERAAFPRTTTRCHFRLLKMPCAVCEDVKMNTLKQRDVDLMLEYNLIYIKKCLLLYAEQCWATLNVIGLNYGHFLIEMKWLYSQQFNCKHEEMHTQTLYCVWHALGNAIVVCIICIIYKINTCMIVYFDCLIQYNILTYYCWPNQYYLFS